MKRILIYLQFFVILGLYGNSLFAQPYFEARVIENENGYLEYQVRSVDASVTPTTTTPIAQISFEIRWPNTSSADVEVLCSNNYYTIVDGLAAKQTKDSYFWRNFVKGQANPVYSDHDWTTNIWETIVEFKITGTAGTTDFEVAPHLWVDQDLVWGQGDPITTYFPVVNGAVSNYSYPTIVYDLVWTGADPTYPTYWDVSGNWKATCGGAGAIPNIGDNCVIPVVASGNYPTNIGQVSGFGHDQPKCGYLRINSGANMTIDDKDEYSTQATYTINNDLLVYGTLNLIPNSQLTVTGDTYLDVAECLVVEATSAGVGSFIDNGTITYGTNGTAKVQTYLSNAAPAGSFDPHLVGPTVNITGTGVTLGDFNVDPGNTYAYQWDEPTGTWQNLYNTTTPIPTAKGIDISIGDASSPTLEMTGELVTGNVSSESMTTGGTGNGDILLSNPYPSAIYWNDMYTDNSSNVNDAVSVWDGIPGSSGNYWSYNTTSGGTGGFNGYLQVGQGFFVESTGTATFDFNNTQRHHSTDPFYSPRSFSNRLDVRINGANYSDGLLIHFYDGALSGYEANEDILKMDSRYDVAPEIWTVLDDSSRLSINALPISLLTRGLLSIPMSFKCGENGDYTLSFFDINTFEAGTEVYLEDKQTGGDWVYLNDNPEYTFTGKPGDLKDRFVIHFFGVTAVNEQVDLSNVYIYSYGRNAYVVNKNKLDIKKVLIYSMSGVMVRERENLPDMINKIWVSDIAGYYVVKVITPQKVFTGKVFISNF